MGALKMTLGLSPHLANLPLITSVRVELGQEARNVSALKPSVTPGSNAVCPYSSFIAPAPQGIGMDMEEPGYFSYCEHRAHVVITCHILLHLIFN